MPKRPQRSAPAGRTVAACLLAVAGVLAPATLPAAPGEYEVKAVLLGRVLEFVQWPDRKGPRELCIIGKDPFGDALEGKVGGRPVRRITSSAAAIDSCGVLFFAEAIDLGYAGLLDDARETPVLTVSDQPGFAERGGMINMATRERRVRFQVNRAAAEAAGLRLSHQFLRLADIVSEPGGTP